MDIRVAVCVGNFIIVDFGKPVISRDRAGVGKNQAAYGIGDSGIFFYAPIGDFYIIVYDFLVIQNG